MKRLFATIRSDARLQFRNGFYYATLFVLLVLGTALSQLPLGSLNLVWLLPAVVLNNLVITTFYFISGLVLLEKSEGTLAALVITPLRIWEYLAAKATTLTLLALVYNLVLVVIIYGPPLAILPLVSGTVLASVVYILAGFVAVARYDSINGYLLPSTLYVAVLLGPVLASASGWEHWSLYLHPLYAPLLLLRAAFEPVVGWQMVYGLLYAVAWIGLLYWLARDSFQRFVIGSERGA